MAHRKSSARLAKDARVAHFLSLAAKQQALNAAQQSFGDSTSTTSTRSDDDNVVDAEVREAT